MIKRVIAKLVKYYFEPKPFEKDRKIYRRLGLGARFFKKRGHTPWDKLLGRCNFFKNKEGILKGRELSSRILETIHLLGFLGFSYMAYLRFIAGDWQGFALAIVLNMMINVYPILLQRYVRVRIYRILKGNRV